MTPQQLLLLLHNWVPKFCALQNGVSPFAAFWTNVPDRPGSAWGRVMEFTLVPINGCIVWTIKQVQNHWNKAPKNSCSFTRSGEINQADPQFRAKLEK